MKFKQDKEVDKKELNEVISLTKKILKVLYVVFVASIILVIIVALQKTNLVRIILDLLKVISPFFIGFIMAWLLRPLAQKLNSKIKNNVISSIIVFGIFILVLILILYVFIPTVYNEVNELVGLLPSFVERITASINNLFERITSSGINLADFKNELLNNITTYAADITKNLPNTIIALIGGLFSGIGTFAMGLIIGIYMLIDYDSINKHFINLFPEHIKDDVQILSNRMSVEVRKCVNGTFLVAFAVLICDSIGFALIGLNAPLLFGLFCGITDLIPFIGPYIGGGIAVVVGFTQAPIIGVLTLIICVIVQMFENYILQPVIMSKASNLHPVIIIIALLVFGHFFGIIGMIFATPCLTIARVILEFTKEKIESRG